MSRWLPMALLTVCCGVWLSDVQARADEPESEPIGTVEFQPLASATGRLLEALQFQGTPLPEADTHALQAILQTGSGRDGVLPSVHTNPIWVQVGNQPIRVPKSAEWCRKAVDICWEAKQKAIRPAERPAAEAAYQQAREYYEKP